MIPFDSLTLSPFNIRKAFRRTNLEWLIKSIKTKGLDLPFLVRKLGVKYEIIIGQRRYMAIKGLIDYEEHDVDKVPCIVAEMNDNEAIRLSARESLLAEFVSGRDKARVVNKVLEEVGSLEEVEKELGIPKTVIEGYLRDLHTNPTTDYTNSASKSVEEVLRTIYKGEEEEEEKKLKALTESAKRAVLRVSLEGLKRLSINTTPFKNRLEALKGLVTSNPKKVLIEARKLENAINKAIKNETERLRAIKQVKTEEPQEEAEEAEESEESDEEVTEEGVESEGEQETETDEEEPESTEESTEETDEVEEEQDKLIKMPITVMKVLEYLSKSTDRRFKNRYDSKEHTKLQTEQGVLNAYRTMASDLVQLASKLKLDINFHKAKCILFTEALKLYLTKNSYYFSGEKQ